MAESRYAPLRQHLAGLKDDEWRVSFADLERVLGFSLPDSARHYTAWWANHNSGSRHSSAWLDQGWRTEELDLDGERLVFRRGPVAIVPGADETACRLGMVWAEMGDIAKGADGMLEFPAVSKTAAIYRFTIRHTAGGESHYVGETNNLVNRLKGYRKPGGPSQKTNVRINGELLKALMDGKQVSMSAVIADAWLEVGGGRLPADLKSKSVRLLFENAAILATPADITMLNLTD